MSAPARRIEVRVSRIAGSRSIQPCAAAASTMAYSPEMLYAATGHVDRVADRADHVEVGQRRLHHHDVGALLDVEQRLAHALDGVGGVLLVGAPVALQRGVDRLAERAVERGGVLRGVGQDRRRRCARRRRAPRGSPRPGRPSSRWGRPCRRRRAAWASAISAYTSSVASLSTRPSGVSTPQWPWSVNSSRHRSLITVSASPTSATTSVIATLRMPVGVDRAGADGVLAARDAEQHHAARARARPPRRRPCAASRGCAGRRPASTQIGAARRAPSRTNTGSTSWRGSQRGLGDHPAQRRRAPQPARPHRGPVSSGYELVGHGVGSLRRGLAARGRLALGRAG